MRSFVTQAEQEKRAFYSMLISHGPAVAEAVLHPFGKKASFSDNEDWLVKFRGTELHQEAIQLAQQELQNSQARDSLCTQQSQVEEGFEPQFKLLRKQGDALDMQKELLNLKLEGLVGQGTVTPPPDPSGLDPAQVQVAEEEVAKAAAAFLKEAKPGLSLGMLGDKAQQLLRVGSRTGGMKPEVAKAIKDSLITNVGGGALLGAAGGYLNADEQKGESGLSGALRGALMGGGLGAVTSGVQGAAGLKGTFDKFKGKGLTSEQALHGTASTMLTPQGKGQLNRLAGSGGKPDAASRLQRMQDKGIAWGSKAPVRGEVQADPFPQSAAPKPSAPAAAAPARKTVVEQPIPDLHLPTPASVAPAAPPSVPDLQLPSRPAAQAPASPPASPAPAPPPSPQRRDLQITPLDPAKQVNYALQRGATPEQIQQLNPGTPVRGPALSPSGPASPPAASGVRTNPGAGPSGPPTNLGPASPPAPSSDLPTSSTPSLRNPAISPSPPSFAGPATPPSPPAQTGGGTLLSAGNGAQSPRMPGAAPLPVQGPPPGVSPTLNMPPSAPPQTVGGYTPAPVPRTVGGGVPPTVPGSPALGAMVPPPRQIDIPPSYVTPLSSSDLQPLSVPPTGRSGGPPTMRDDVTTVSTRDLQQPLHLPKLPGNGILPNSARAGELRMPLPRLDPLQQEWAMQGLAAGRSPNSARLSALSVLAMKILNLRVLSLDYATRQLIWDVADDARDNYLDYELQVERSESSKGPYDPISPYFQVYQRFVDTKVPIGHRYRQLYYRIRYRRRVGGAESVSMYATQEASPSRKALAIRRQLHLLYRNGKGRRAWLLPVRTTGRRCPSCWDPSTDQRVSSRCITCYDTTWYRGFLHPIEIFIDIDPSSNENNPTQAGNFQQNTTTARLGHYPGVKMDDLIIEGENHRWRVISLSTTEYMRAPLQQHLNLQEVGNSDIEMQVPLDLGQALEDVWLSPHERRGERVDRDAIIDAAASAFFGRKTP